jgi:hypothetical protein
MGMATNTKRKRKMNDFEQLKLADEVAGLHEVVEALLLKMDACCCNCNCADAEDEEEEEQ